MLAEFAAPPKSKMKSIKGPPRVKSRSEQERQVKIENEIAMIEGDAERVRARIPSGIRIAAPGATRVAMNLAKEPPIYSRQLIVIAQSPESPNMTVLWHVSPSGQWSKSDTLGSNYAALVNHAFAQLDAHDLIITQRPTFAGKPVGPKLTWDELSGFPDDDMTVTILRDGGPTDPDRAYGATCYSASITLKPYGSLNAALLEAKEELLNAKPKYSNRGGFVYRVAATVAHMPPDASGLPRWIYGEGLLPDNRERLAHLRSQLEELKAIPEA